MRQIAGLIAIALGLFLLVWAVMTAWTAAVEPRKSDLGQEGLIIYTLIYGALAVGFLVLGWLGLRRRE